MSYSYIRRVPSVSTYNGVGSYGIDFPMPGFIEELLGDREDVAGEGGPPPIDLTPLPVYCADGSTAAVINGVAYCKPPGGGGGAAAPPNVPASPPKTIATPGPATPGPASPPAASSGGLSTMTLVGGGVAALAVVGGLVYWKKSKKGGRR